MPTPAESVELVASDMKGAEDTPLFSSAESILKGVRHILAREIAAEPRVKAKYVLPLLVDSDVCTTIVVCTTIS